MVRIMVLLSKKKNGLMMIVKMEMEMILVCQRNLWFVMRILVLSITVDFSSL